MHGPRYCLLDIDGVLGDFVGAACRAHGVENPYEHPESPHRGKFDMSEVLGMDPGKFWLPFNDHETWAEMEPTEDMEEIIDVACRAFPVDRIALCSAPSASPFSASGKMEWVKKHLFGFRRRLILTPAKHFLAHEGVVLIDDRTRNCVRFREAGGNAILAPRPWNADHNFSDATVEVIRELLETFYERPPTS